MSKVLVMILVFFTLFYQQQVLCGNYLDEVMSENEEQAKNTLFEIIGGLSTEFVDLAPEIKRNSITERVAIFLKGLDVEVKRKIINSLKEHRTPLHKALISRNLALVRMLLNHGADIFMIPQGGNSTFHLAIHDIAVLQEVLNILFERNLTDVIPVECGKVVYYSIFEQKFECLQMLVAEGSPFRQFKNIDIMNVTPLHVAFGEGHPEAVRILLEAGVDYKKAVQVDRILPIHVAAAKGNIDGYNLLLSQFEKEKNKRLEEEFVDDDEFLIQRTFDTAMTPKHFASFRGNRQVLTSLLQKTLTDLNFKSTSGMTPLHYAVSEGHADCVDTLLPYHPNLFATDGNGNDVLTYASFKDRYNCGARVIAYINSNREVVEKSPNLNQDLFFHKKTWLVLSAVDTTQNKVVTVHSNPSFEEFIEDVKKIREALLSDAKDVASNGIGWKKYKLLHLRYEPCGQGSAVLRDYFMKNSRLIFDNKMDLFLSNDDGRSYGFTHQAGELSAHTLEVVNLIGAFTALAILSNPVHLPFASYIFKAVAGERLNPSDFIDQATRDHLKGLENLSSEEFDNVNLPTSYRVQLSRDKENIEEISLLEEKEFLTKEDFSKYKAKLIHLLTYGGQRNKLIDAFKEGFYSLIPKHLLQADNVVLNTFIGQNLISADELQLAVSECAINVDEWKKYTRYSHALAQHDEQLAVKNSPQVQWFWKFVENADTETRKKLLKFCTGSDRLPFGGFRYLHGEKIPFSIEIAKNESLVFPASQACFYTISLPQLQNEEKFMENLTYAIENCEGFQFE